MCLKYYNFKKNINTKVLKLGISVHKNDYPKCDAGQVLINMEKNKMKFLLQNNTQKLKIYYQLKFEKKKI